jgi:hypothetical protein
MNLVGSLRSQAPAFFGPMIDDVSASCCYCANFRPTLASKVFSDCPTVLHSQCAHGLVCVGQVDICVPGYARLVCIGPNLGSSFVDDSCRLRRGSSSRGVTVACNTQADTISASVGPLHVLVPDVLVLAVAAVS